ncbi:MAG: DinB family protein, partial [Anaerolineales bacterium]
QSFVDMQEKFLAERKQSLEWLRGLANPNWETTYTSQYGSVSAGEMFACWIAHDNLHVRQLVGLRRVKIENITKPYIIEYAGDW